MHEKLVRATPSVIAWAIRESGYSLSALATLLKVDESEIDGWTMGHPPEIGKLKALAKEVKRPFSAFLLPEPPTASHPSVKFRSSTAATRRPLNPEERRRIREAVRLQTMLASLSSELRLPLPNVPTAAIGDDPEHVAVAIRKRLKLSLRTQLAWSSPGDALRGWRDVTESLGVAVLTLPMGEESCRGFSIWDDAAPLIAINTAWLQEARLFTLIHELGHLSSRTNSACAENAVARSSAGDRTERWCDRVAAAVLIPVDGLEKALAKVPASTRRQGDLALATWIAAQFRVSRRSAALRLIECKEAKWSLFRSFPPHRERLQSGGGGAGRTRTELRSQRYGQRTIALFQDGFRGNVVGPAEVIDYLGVSADALMGIPSNPASRGDD